MKLQLLAVGQKMPAWITEGFHNYAKRLPSECALFLKEIAPAVRGKSGQPQKWQQEEGQRLLQQIPADHQVIALEVTGKSWSTEKLAEEMLRWQSDGRDISLLIGGPDGLSADCLARADKKWSLSPLTLPHPLVRVVVAEQLYRAWSINNNHPYHRA